MQPQRILRTSSRNSRPIIADSRRPQVRKWFRGRERTETPRRQDFAYDARGGPSWSGTTRSRDFDVLQKLSVAFQLIIFLSFLSHVVDGLVSCDLEVALALLLVKSVLQHARATMKHGAPYAYFILQNRAFGALGSGASVFRIELIFACLLSETTSGNLLVHKRVSVSFLFMLRSVSPV